MDMGRASGVVAWENGVELHDAVFVRLLDTTAVGRVQAALARGGDARVYARGVASPLQEVILANSYYDRWPRAWVRGHSRCQQGSLQGWVRRYLGR